MRDVIRILSTQLITFGFLFVLYGSMRKIKGLAFGGGALFLVGVVILVGILNV